MKQIPASRISEACLALFAPGLGPGNYVQRGFEFLRKLVPGEFMACGLLHSPTSRLDLSFDEAHPDFPTAMAALGRLMHQYPLHNWDPSVNDGRPFCRSHFFSARQFRQLDVYQEVYRPLGIDNHCALHIPSTPDEVFFFGIERDGGPDFTDDDLTLLTHAQAHLTNALTLARLLPGLSDDEIVTPEALSRAGLTPREAEVLHWISKGKSNPEVATLMGIGLHTVKDHVASIFNKTGVGNRIAAILWARDTCRRDHQGVTHRPGFISVATPSKVG